MSQLRYTLVADGPSDRALLAILTWLLRQHLKGWAIQPVYADLWRLPQRPDTLAERVVASIELFPCDLLFIHRDAEGQPPEWRFQEIANALQNISATRFSPLVVSVVPVRMQEAWLLIDEQALRQAAGNPNGRQPLLLPTLSHLEDHADPKEAMRVLLLEASGLRGRRRRQFDIGKAAKRVAEYIDDFAPLRHLSAFRKLEEELLTVIHDQGWQPQP